MKISSNKSKKTVSVKSSSALKSIIRDKTPDNRESYSIRQIKNGWLIDKSWCDEKGNYKSETIYSETNPLDELTEKGEE